MRMTTTLALTGLLGTTLMIGSALALDCARVKALHAENKKPSEIARELGITTPDVQACLADEQPAAATDSRNRSRSLSSGATIPAVGSGVHREPNQ